jgi:hypothetical protein
MKEITVTLRIPVTEAILNAFNKASYEFDDYFLDSLTGALEDKLMPVVGQIVLRVADEVESGLNDMG